MVAAADAPVTAVQVFVPGEPKPQGSKRHVGRGILVESCRELGPWRERVALAAHNARVAAGLDIMAGPLTLTLAFILPRPQSAPKRTTPHAAKRPDLDKLCRAVLDAITNVLIRDDSQIVALHAGKRVAEIGETPGVSLRLWAAPLT